MLDEACLQLLHVPLAIQDQGLDDEAPINVVAAAAVTENVEARSAPASEGRPFRIVVGSRPQRLTSGGGKPNRPADKIGGATGLGCFHRDDHGVGPVLLGREKTEGRRRHRA